MTSEAQVSLLLVCQAGLRIGLGHLSRTQVAAKTLRPDNYQLHLLIQADAGFDFDTDNELKASRISFEQSLSDYIISYVENGCALIIFDLQPQHIPENFIQLLTQLRALNVKTIAIDALVQFRSLLDVIYTPSLLPNAQLDSIEQQKSLYGWDSFLLKVATAIEPRHTDGVLILTGGADTTRLGSHWLIELDQQLPVELAIHWVQGPFAAKPVLPVKTLRKITIYNSPSNLINLMNQVSYAITLYGVSFFELLYYGVPTVVFSPYNHKDDTELNEIARQQVALVATDHLDAIVKLQQLLDSASLANKISETARKTLSKADGQKIRNCVASLLRTA